MSRALTVLVAGGFLQPGLAGASGPDTDGDGVGFFADNCTLAANPGQRDTDGDGIGNLCDGDFNNDCVVNATDLGEFKNQFFAVGDTPYDLNGDGAVNPVDLGLFKGLFFLDPGPSGLADVCDGPGPYGDPIWVRGSWDGFAVTPEGRLDHVGDGVYTTTIELDGDTLRYKVAGESFDQADTNCNPPADNTPTILAEALLLHCDAAAHVALLDLRHEPDAVVYRFVLRAGTSPTEPHLTITREAPAPAPVAGDTQAPVFGGPLTLDPPDDPISLNVRIDAPASDDLE